MRRHLIPLALLALAACDSPTADLTLETEGSGQTSTPVATLSLPAVPFNYAAAIPGFALPQVDAEDNTPSGNPVTDAGAALGRVLFYERQLSANGTVSCASCHQQRAGFADPQALSDGFDGGQTTRNAMSVANVRFYRNGRMFWDERAMSVEDQSLQPVQHPVEMGLTLDEAILRVAGQPYYADLFTAAYGDPTVTADRMERALAQFERAMVTFNSRYDAARAGQTGPPGRPLAGLTAQENQGLELFFSDRTQCSRCHQGDLFVGDQARNNGLDANTSADEGVGGGRFKAPSLRNIELTAPYMHDGRLATLRDAVEHYNTGIQNHPNLDNRLERNGQPIRMNLSGAEVDALVAFMRTLTDPSLVSDERFSDPFIR